MPNPTSSAARPTSSSRSIDEAQDVSEDKYFRDFRPMGSTANVTTVLYGTAWSEDTLLANQRAANLRDDPGADFAYPWTVLAELNPSYKAYVSSEIRRLGPDHPIIKTQYLLESLESAGRLFDARHLALLQGGHASEDAPDEELPMYVAGIDVAGESETMPDELVRRKYPRKDSTVVTIARVTRPSESQDAPAIEVVHHYWWTGRDHSSQYAALLDLLQSRWRCQAVCVDATGVGAGVASWLARSMPVRVEQVQFTRPLEERPRLRAAGRRQRRPPPHVPGRWLARVAGVLGSGPRVPLRRLPLRRAHLLRRCPPRP